MVTAMTTKVFYVQQQLGNKPDVVFFHIKRTMI